MYRQANNQIYRTVVVIWLTLSVSSCVFAAMTWNRLSRRLTETREALAVHADDLGGDVDLDARVLELLEDVRLPASQEILTSYPHQLSGGQQQRIGIAMAFACRPRLIVLDEPTTGLDVTTQRHVLETVRGLTDDHGVSAVYVSHDLPVVGQIADATAVMYAGRIVEDADVMTLYAKPAHPYTEGLLDSMPRVDSKGAELYAIKGLPPSLLNLPPGCNFNPRCPYKKEICLQEVPPSYEVADHHHSACHFWEEVYANDRADSARR